MTMCIDVTKHFDKDAPLPANELSHFLYCIIFTRKCVGGAAFIVMKKLNFQY